MKQFNIAALTVVISLIFSACGGGGGSSEPPPTPVPIDTLSTYHVKQLSFLGNLWEIGNAEVEIHVVDADTNTSVLCAGVENGMQVVQEMGHDYDDLDVNFVRTNGSSLEEVTTFFYIVLERDSPQCPQPPDYPHDTTLAKSFDMKFGDLKDGIISLNSGTLTLEQRGEDPDPIEVGELANLRLKSIFIDALDSGESSDPEIEIHLMDVLDNSVVACMGGADRRMDAINRVSALYDHLYVQPELATGVDGTETASWLRVVMVERDNGIICPEPFVIGSDRVVGSSHVMSGDELLAGGKIIFPQDAAWMEMAVEDTLLESLGSVPATGFDGITVHSLRYYGDINEFSPPEVEVHIKDVWEEETIACAGEDHGLAGVNTGGTLYEGLNAALVNAWSREDDPIGYVRVVIVDRDSGAICPSSASHLSDDYLAEIVVPSDQITAGPIEFDDGSLIEFRR